MPTRAPTDFFDWMMDLPHEWDRWRLSPRFVEWMMMLPEGWVTDVPGLSRSAMLRLLGNGIVPPQAVHALRLLLDRRGAA